MRDRLGNSLWLRGDIARLRGDHGAAVRLFQESLEPIQKLAKDAPGDPSRQGAVGEIHAETARAAVQLGDFAAAAQSWQDASAAYERAAGLTTNDKAGTNLKAQLLMMVANCHAQHAAAVEKTPKAAPDAQPTRQSLMDKAIEAFSKAIDAGCSDWPSIEKDAELEPLRQDPRYDAIKARKARQG
jgi:tetratricopeptide (TPR) repeat protein